MLHIPKLCNSIGSEKAAPLLGKYIENYCPATGRLINLVPDSDASDIELAVNAAAQAFQVWKSVTSKERAQFLLKIAFEIENKAEAFALAETTDQGKPLNLSRSMDIPRAVENFRFFASALVQEEGDSYLRDSDLLSYTTRNPVGVCALITPWNLPLYLLTWKIAPALAAGNTVVCKPSELTSTTASMLSEIMHSAGLPPGVCNFVYGYGSKAGQALVSHPKVAAVSFTGGTETGKKIAALAAPQFKKLSLELGGKNASIVFEDAHLNHAIQTSARAAFLNQGEICLCGSRIYVQRSVFQKFLDGFLAEVAKFNVGNPEDPNTTIGALISSEHRSKIESYVEIALQEGATIHSGGKRPKVSEHCSEGYFYEPTVITGVRPDSRLQQEEIFGPVVTLSPFDHEEEVIALANSTQYGLSCVIFTNNLSKAHQVSAKIEAGTVWVNTWLARDLRTPFGGVKSSGVGREGGKHSLDFYSHLKTTALNISSI
jgi:aminomuconate-semialdehyde/2-hydroxymuconate-6-semialdehyde dehydrogenase